MIRNRNSGGTWDSGFTLIEIVAALLLFSLGVLMVIGMSGGLGTQIQYAAISSELVVVAQERLDSLETEPPESLVLGTDVDTVAVGGRSYERSVTISRYSPLVREIVISLESVTGSGPSYSATSYVSSNW